MTFRFDKLYFCGKCVSFRGEATVTDEELQLLETRPAILHTQHISGPVRLYVTATEHVLGEDKCHIWFEGTWFEEKEHPGCLPGHGSNNKHLDQQLPL